MRPIAAHAVEDRPLLMAAVIDLIPIDGQLTIYALPLKGHSNVTQAKAHEVAPTANGDPMTKSSSMHSRRNPVGNLGLPSATNAR